MAFFASNSEGHSFHDDTPNVATDGKSCSRPASCTERAILPYLDLRQPGRSYPNEAFKDIVDEATQTQFDLHDGAQSDPDDITGMEADFERAWAELDKQQADLQPHTSMEGEATPKPSSNKRKRLDVTYGLANAGSDVAFYSHSQQTDLEPSLALSPAGFYEAGLTPAKRIKTNSVQSSKRKAAPLGKENIFMSKQAAGCRPYSIRPSRSLSLEIIEERSLKRHTPPLRANSKVADVKKDLGKETTLLKTEAKINTKLEPNINTDLTSRRKRQKVEVLEIKDESDDKPKSTQKMPTKVPPSATLGSVNGTYDLLCAEADQEGVRPDRTLKLIFDSPFTWGEYKIGASSGILCIPERIFSASEDDHPFHWRGKKHQNRQMPPGFAYSGFVKFLGGGRIEGILGVDGEIFFTGRRRAGSGTPGRPADSIKGQFIAYGSEGNRS